MTKVNPYFSIITVCYNSEKTIERTISSLRNQTFRNFEYIIIDGGSTDSTLEIIKKNQDVVSVLVSEKDEGIYDAMNKGINLASGEMVGIINSDDWYEPNAVELVVNAYVDNPDKRIFHGDRFDILEDETRKVRKFHPSRFKFVYYGMTYHHPSMFVHRNIYANELYNIKYHLSISELCF